MIFFPFLIGVLDGLVVETKVVDDDIFDSLGVGTLKTQVEEARLLGQEPFP